MYEGNPAKHQLSFQIRQTITWQKQDPNHNKQTLPKVPSSILPKQAKANLKLKILILRVLGLKTTVNWINTVFSSMTKVTKLTT